MRTLAAVVALVMLAGCRDWPDPVIRSITPAEMVASETTRVEIRADVALASTVDYANKIATVETAATLRIGSQELGDGRFPKDGVFTVDVVTVFGPGSYDVEVELPDGRKGLLPRGFYVLPGNWPDGYTIDAIGPQERFVPFTITVRAVDSSGATFPFRGNVRLAASAGASIGPTLSGQFVDGVLTQQVVLNSTQTQEVINVTDAVGHQAQSNIFQFL